MKKIRCVTNLMFKNTNLYNPLLYCYCVTYPLNQKIAIVSSKLFEYRRCYSEIPFRVQIESFVSATSRITEHIIVYVVRKALAIPMLSLLISLNIQLMSYLIVTLILQLHRYHTEYNINLIKKKKKNIFSFPNIIEYIGFSVFDIPYFNCGYCFMISLQEIIIFCTLLHLCAQS